MRFLIGTYTDQTDSAGIYVIDNGQDDRFEVLAQATIWLRNASYLIEHPVLPLVYAVSEIGEAPGGQVAILRQETTKAIMACGRLLRQAVWIRAI